MSEIKKMYNKYIENLSYDEQLELYKTHSSEIIPQISFYDFMNKIKE